MAVGTLQLPKDKGSLSSLVNRHGDREDSRVMARRTMWLLAWYYLNGYRRFDEFDPSTGRISPHLLDENGDMEFQCQELLSAIDRVQAKMNEMDVLPFVRGVAGDASLARIRERATGQILLDAVVSPGQIETETKRLFNFMLAAYGSAGVQGHLSDHPVVGLSADLEAIHPRELFSWPSLGQDHTKRQGLMRQHLVPISYLKEIFGPSKIQSNLDKMYWFETDPGATIATERDSDSRPQILYSGQSGTGMLSTDPMKESVGVARIRQLWIDGVRGTCSRYIVVSGDYVLADEDLSTKEAYCPIGFARFLESGSFHGMGMFDLLYGINRQMEFLLKNVFNNTLDNDRFGILVLPTGVYNERAMMRDKGTGMRVMPVSYDPLSERQQPFHIPPPNTGDAPARVAQMAKAFMEQINPVRDLAEEKGRLEGAAGLQYLDEQIQKGMTNPTMGVQNAFGQCYRSLCSRVARQVMLSPRPLPVNRLSPDLAGAVIDPADNSVSFPENPLPDVSRLTFGIKEANPKSKTARKEEALNLFQLTQDLDGLKIVAVKEGLDFAMFMGEEEAAYEAFVRNYLTVFNDGKTPGQFVTTEFMLARPDFQIRLLNAEMGSSKVQRASIEVQDALADWKETLLQVMGGVLPPGVPTPEDAAMMGPAGVEAGGGPAMMGGGGAGPPQVPQLAGR